MIVSYHTWCPVLLYIKILELYEYSSADCTAVRVISSSAIFALCCYPAV